MKIKHWLSSTVAHLSRVVFDKTQGFTFRVGGFIALFLGGLLVYCLCPIGAKGDVGPTPTCFLTFLEAINRTSLSFFRSLGGLEECSALGYHLFQLAVMVYVGGLMCSYLGKDLVNRLCIWLSDDAQTLAIWGYSHRGEMLVDALQANSEVKDVIFMLPLSDEIDSVAKRRITQAVAKLQGKYKTIGCHWRFVDYDRLTEEDVAANRHCFLLDSGRENVLLADSVVKLRSSVKNEAELELFVRVESSSDEMFFARWMVQNRKVNTRIVKESDVIATQFVRDYPVPMSMGRSRFKMLLIGFGTNGKSVLRGAVENFQCVGREFGVDVVDEDPEKWELFAATHEDAVREYSLGFIYGNAKGNASSDCNNPGTAALRYGTAAFVKWIDKQIESNCYDRIVICLGDDKKTISCCADIERLLKSRGKKVERGFLFAQLDDRRQTKFYSEYLGAELSESTVHFFGALEDVYDFHYIYDEAVDVVAKSMARKYNELKQVVANWSDLNWLKRQSNLALALRQIVIVEGLDCDVVPSCSKGDGLSEDVFDARLANHMLGNGRGDAAVDENATGQVLEFLAECEHMRWNAFHFMRGIRTLSLEEARLRQSTAANQIAACNAHAALVPWGKLPDVDEALGKKVGTLQGYDRAFYYGLFRSINGAGLKIVAR